MEAYVNMYILHSIYAQIQCTLCLLRNFFRKKKEKQSNIHCQTIHLILVLLPFLWKPLLVPSRTGSLQRATVVQLSYGKRSIIQGQQSYCQPLTSCQDPGTQPAHIHIKHHSFLDTGFLHSLLTGPYCCPSLPISLIAHIFPWGHISISDAGTSNVLRIPLIFCYNQNWNMVLKRLIQTSQEFIYYSWLGRNKDSPSNRAPPSKSFSHQNAYNQPRSATSAPTLACYCNMASQ